MQRLHGWFDQLTLRKSRRSRDSRRANERRVASQSVAPSCRFGDEKRQLKPVNAPFINPQRPDQLNSSWSSCTRRKGIRTNPWLYNSHPPPGQPNSISSSLYPLVRPLPPPYLGVKHMDESTCSSGYGSQDCSPDSSMTFSSWQSASPRGTWKSNSPDGNWQNARSENWQDSRNDNWQRSKERFSNELIEDECFMEESSSFSTYDNICDEHIYYELEQLCRRQDRSYSSDCLSTGSESPQPKADFPVQAASHSHAPSQHSHASRSFSHGRVGTFPSRQLPKCDAAQRAESPIYAQPWTTYSPIQTPLVVRNHSFTPEKSVPCQPRRKLPMRPISPINMNRGVSPIGQPRANSPIYATPYTGPMVKPRAEENAFIYPGSFFKRCEKNVTRKEAAKSLEEAEEEFLTELDEQINELQQRSEELRNLVELARVRRGTQWSKPVMECTFELDL